jgi:hypothetical protein
MRLFSPSDTVLVAKYGPPFPVANQLTAAALLPPAADEGAKSNEQSSKISKRAHASSSAFF